MKILDPYVRNSVFLSLEYLNVETLVPNIKYLKDTQG